MEVVRSWSVFFLTCLFYANVDGQVHSTDNPDLENITPDAMTTENSITFDCTKLVNPERRLAPGNRTHNNMEDVLVIQDFFSRCLGHHSCSPEKREWNSLCEHFGFEETACTSKPELRNQIIICVPTYFFFNESIPSGLVRLHSGNHRARFITSRMGTYPEISIYLGESLGLTIDLYYMYDVSDKSVQIKISGANGANCTFIDQTAPAVCIWSSNSPVTVSFISNSKRGRFGLKYHVIQDPPNNATKEHNIWPIDLRRYTTVRGNTCNDSSLSKNQDSTTTKQSPTKVSFPKGENSTYRPKGGTVHTDDIAKKLAIGGGVAGGLLLVVILILVIIARHRKRNNLVTPIKPGRRTAVSVISQPYEDINPDDVGGNDSYQQLQQPDLLYMRGGPRYNIYKNISPYTDVKKGSLEPRPLMGSKHSLTITENELYSSEPKRYENVDDQRDSGGLFIVENEGYISVNSKK